MSEAQNERKKALQKVQATVLASLPLGPHDPANLKGLKVSVAGRDAVWGLREVLSGELQHRTLGFWSKALLSSADNCSPHEKQFLACYKIL